MLDKGGDRSNRPDTQTKIVFGRHCLPWSEEELKTLRSLAPNRVCKRTLAKLFPERSDKACRKQLHLIREEMGLKRERPPSLKGRAKKRVATLNPDDPGLSDFEHRRWCQKAETSNQRYLAALQKMAA